MRQLCTTAGSGVYSQERSLDARPTLLARPSAGPRGRPRSRLRARPLRPEPGQLSVRFDTAEDLVEKLFTLGQALANDYESLEAALAGTEGSQDHHGSG